MRKLKKYTPTKFMAKDSKYDKSAADFAVNFIECLCHTKGTWAGKPFELIDWQEQIIRDIFGTVKLNGYRQFNTAYIEIPKKQGKSELAAAVALLLTCGDGEERYGSDVSCVVEEGQNPRRHQAHRISSDQLLLPGSVRRSLLQARLQYPRRRFRRIAYPAEPKTL